MADDIQTLERAVAQFVVDFDSRHINNDAREDVKRLIKDQLAIQIGASQLPWSKQVRKFRNLRCTVNSGHSFLKPPVVVC